MKKRVLSLFSGCGGMDLGFEGDFNVLKRSVGEMFLLTNKISNTKDKWVHLPKTSFETVFSNDILRGAKAAWIPYFKTHRHSKGEFHLGSIVDLVKAFRAGNKSVFPASIDVVTGGFPCQDFSLAGKRKGFNSHKGHHGGLLTEADEAKEENRGKLYMWMKDVVDITRPKMFIAENVKGLVSLENVKQIIEDDFRKIGGGGYVVVPARVLHAANYGVPQTRERVLFYGFKRSALKAEALKALTSKSVPGEYDPYPVATHKSSANRSELITEMDLLPVVTIKEALAGLPEPEVAKEESQKWYSKAKYYGPHLQGQIEVDPNKPGPTIRSEHHGNIEFRRLAKNHGGKNLDELNKGLKERRLTVRECARIQTFPDDYEFVRKNGENPISSSEGYKVIGNAVPPLLAYHVAARLEKLWPKLFRS